MSQLPHRVEDAPATQADNISAPFSVILGPCYDASNERLAPHRPWNNKGGYSMACTDTMREIAMGADKSQFVLGVDGTRRCPFEIDARDLRVFSIRTKIAILCALPLLGCVSVPVSNELVSYHDAGMVRTKDAACAKAWLVFPNGAERGSALDPAGFRLMTWNVYKAQAEHWPDDFARLSAGQDLILLQEAHLTPLFRAVLDQTGYWWSMVRAFDFNGAEAGVLTAGRAPASGACLSRVVEPMTHIPKSMLLTRYPLVDSTEELWVANLHGINFSLVTERFREQLESLAGVLEPHSGPLVVAGDFNNWSERRSDILRRITRRLKLATLRLADDERSRHWGRPVDHVFYRGIEVAQAEAVEVSSSDHNPVRVQFHVPALLWRRKQ